ncbi:MAG: hypothetical protein A3K19_00685 [Lentisphaerae bacterium RIFOXYB12_FULL_65_16]|nr:MAG: hypothetical protein A3K18_14825 [Lentisphaerae bacterium RIFOXYA12_64_32]OGV86805.1 MAG: hypothetical protein A3K19_00685 [Lentisphaerae bacterium RIFOXYB12_FULL_65_16]
MSDEMIDLSRLAPSDRTRLVAAEPNSDGTASLYVRAADGSVTIETAPFRPWLLVSGEALAAAVPGSVERRKLDGSGILNVLVHFPDEATHEAGLKYLRTETGCSPSSPQAPYRAVSDVTQQFLSLLPARLFRDMSFAELRRMQVDIETVTTPGYDFCNAERDDDRIILIAMRDSTGWERCLGGPDVPEAAMLQEFVARVRERDPDVIEGHNIFNFDLPYIGTRCKRHKVRLKLGRDGSVITSRSSRFTAGEHTSTYQRYDIYGRHIIDTMHLVQLYDVSHRDLDSYGLKSVAKYFGVAAKKRTYIDPSKIGELIKTQPDLVRDYAMDDVRETDAVSRLLSPSYFYQAQLVPFSYQNCVTRGNAARIDAMLVAAYLRAGASIPSPQASRNFRGGLTDSLQSGIFQNVWHVDVQSLYPSIIIAGQMSPRVDTLGIFCTLLTELRRFRLLAKQSARNAVAEQRENFEALQSSFKVLINSFYGYTGFSQGTFNDYDMAETITARGREILQSMVDFLKRENATVIEIDTDGIYFVPPPGVADPAALLQKIQATLPAGIDVDLDSTYATMFGYKSKNYALLDHDGKVRITGAALKSRGLEPFQRRFIREAVELLLTGHKTELTGLNEKYADAIRNHALPITDFAQRETLSQSPRVYQQKLESGEGKRSAAYDLALKATAREYRQGDQVAFYVTGEKKSVKVSDAAKLLADAKPDVRDENVPYYLNKLESLYKKFAEFA